MVAPYVLISILYKGDIKPANFLYDRKKKLFKLVDFGLAQRTGEIDESKEPKARHPQCKRKLTSSDLANSMESPPPRAPSDKRRRMIHPSSERGSNRKVLAERYVLRHFGSGSSQNVSLLLTFRTMDNSKVNNLSNLGTTPTRTEKPDEEYYDKRGAILSARKRTRSSLRQQRPKLSDDLDRGDPSDQEIILCSGAPADVPRTPNKNVETLKATPEVRRSPRYYRNLNVPTVCPFNV